MDRLCQRYDALYGLPYAGPLGQLDPEVREALRDEILALASADDESDEGVLRNLVGILQMCGDG